MSRKIISVVGARPNFIKIAPIFRCLQKTRHITPLLVHTGQHYDPNMSQQFFQELEIPRPNWNLGIGSGSHVLQIAQVMRKLEPIVRREKPSFMLVVGDVNSTLAAALTAVKMGVPVAHVEAGLRSFDRTMPEETNRLLTDQLADLLFVTEPSGRKNLLREGIPEEKVFPVGNVMIDTLVANRQQAEASGVLEELDLEPGRFAVLTLHRPSNVDVAAHLKSILEAIEVIQKDFPVVFPIHPRTTKNIETHGLKPFFERLTNIRTTPPLGYLNFLKLISHARLVLTDPGGLQEETTFLGIPCLTLRENTERPITVELGTNVLVGWDSERIVSAYRDIAADRYKQGQIPPLWDGHTADRIVDVLLERV